MSELSKAKNRKVGFVLGLTGGIATGKSTAAKVFQSHGFPLIDGDVIARETVEPGTLALRKIVSVFGQEVLQPDGQLDRGKLGMIVFPSKEKRQKAIRSVYPKSDKRSNRLSKFQSSFSNCRYPIALRRSL